MFKKFRRYVIALLNDPNDDEPVEIVKIPDPEEDVDLHLIRNNDLYHHAMALNSIHIRLGGVEAKVGFIQSMILMVLGVVMSPHIEWVVDQLIKGF